MTLADALARRGIRFRVSGPKLHLNCVFCVSRGKSPDTRMRLCIHTQIGWGKCVACDWSHRYAVKPVLRELSITYEVSEGQPPPEEQKLAPIVLPADFQILTNTHEELDVQAKDYILKRGITERQIEKHRIGVSYSGRYAYRILFPVYMNGQLNSINARDFTGRRKPKYLLSPGVKALYNFNPKAETVVLSEGVIKALRIARVSAHNSSALLGHDLTDLQLEQLQKSSCKNIIIYPDTDSVGKRGAVKVADKLIDNWRGRISFVWPVTLPADEVPLLELRELLLKSVPFTGLSRPKFLF